MKLFTISPVFDQNAVTVVLATDDNYVDYVSVVLVSILHHSSSEKKYDIILLENDVAEVHKQMLSEILRDKPNFSLRFFNLTEYVRKQNFNIVSYYSEAIYFRVFMPYIMPDYKKAIYLDCDLVVLRDLAELFDTDIKDNLLAAVPDIGVLQHYCRDDRGLFSRKYFQTRLSDVKIEEYFNSGVLVMNLSEFRKQFSLHHLIKVTNRKYLNFPDQDGLNIVCTGKTYLLPYRWNLLPEHTGMRKAKFLQNDVPKQYFDAYMTARTDPAIIHYAMREKPWKHTCQLDFDLMIRFWQYASETPVFRKILLTSPLSDAEKKRILLRFGSPEDLAEWEKQRKLTVQYESCEIRNHRIILEATVMADVEDVDDIAAHYIVGEKIYACDILSGNKDCKFDRDVMETQLCLKTALPTDQKETDAELQITLRGKPMIPTLEFSPYFPVSDQLDEQYCYIGNRIITFSAGKLRIREATRRDAKKQEKKFRRALIKTGEKRYLKSWLVRKFISAARIFLRKPIWIVGDNTPADDNGFAFFRYLQQKKRAVRSYFIIDDNCDKNTLRKVKKTGRTVYAGSKKYKILTLLCDAYFDSVVYVHRVSPFGGNEALRDLRNKRAFVFLQHGVITQDLSPEHNKYIYHPYGFIVSAKPEYRALLDGTYHYTENEIWLTGLARFDQLYHDEKKLITVMPTWRASLYPELPETSDFFRFYDALLHDVRLQNALKQYGYSLVLKLHPLLKSHAHKFKHGNDDDAFQICERDYKTTFAESNLIVTDYSSAIFDFLYLNKPILYSQFDKEEFFSEHVYKQGYGDYETNGFGEVEYDLDGTVNRIIEYLSTDCRIKPEYAKRADEFFAFRDRNNRKRIFDTAYKKLYEKE